MSKSLLFADDQIGITGDHEIIFLRLENIKKSQDKI